MAGGLPLVIPAGIRVSVSVAELMEVCDGFLFTGGRGPTSTPEEYGEAATEAHGAFDRAARRGWRWPLIRACVERGQPFLGVCRGFQGGECRHGRHALPRDPRPAGADESPDAARWHESRRKFAPAPRRDADRGGRARFTASSARPR